MRKDVLAGAAAVGAALVGGALVYYLREKQTEEPDYRALATDGDFQIREYPAMTVAETVVVRAAQARRSSEGFSALADYIFAKIARRREIADDGAGDAGRAATRWRAIRRLFDDELEGGWRTRFVMPGGRDRRATCPSRPRASSWSSSSRAGSAW